MKISLILLYFSFSVFADENNCDHDNITFRCVKYIKNYDADSITFEIPNVHPLLGDKISIRVLGLDTPEINGKNICEKNKAKEARDFVTKLMTTAKRIDLESIKRDKYFRIDADVRIDGKSLTEVLLEKGFAYPYWGKTKRQVDWCKPLDDQRVPASQNTK